MGASNLSAREERRLCAPAHPPTERALLQGGGVNVSAPQKIESSPFRGKGGGYGDGDVAIWNGFFHPSHTGTLTRALCPSRDTERMAAREFRGKPSGPAGRAERGGSPPADRAGEGRCAGGGGVLALTSHAPQASTCVPASAPHATNAEFPTK